MQEKLRKIFFKWGLKVYFILILNSFVSTSLVSLIKFKPQKPKAKFNTFSKFHKPRFQNSQTFQNHFLTFPWDYKP